MWCDQSWFYRNRALGESLMDKDGRLKTYLAFGTLPFFT